MSSAKQGAPSSRILGLGMALLVAGCATTASMRPSGDHGPLGMPRYYHSVQSVIFQTAQDAARELGLTIIASVPEQAYFIAKHGIPVFSCGTLVGVYVQGTVDNFTRVLIRNEPIFPASLCMPEYALDLHTLLGSKLHALPPPKPRDTQGG